MTATENPRSGIDLSWVDETIRPQDDLFGHVNGKWLATHEIPDDRAADGSFRALHDQAQEDVRVLIENSAKLEGREAQMIAGLYASFMDAELIETLGTAPVQPTLDEIANVTDRKQLAVIIGRLQRQGRVALIGNFISQDAKNSARYLAHLNQSGLGLPDESYYKGDENAALREAYVAHLAKLSDLFGFENSAALADTVMNLETAIAEISWDRVTNRDAEKTYTLMTAAELKEHAPDFAWDEWLIGLGAPSDSLDEVIVRQPSFIAGVNKLWAERSLEEWKQWMMVHTASAVAPYLTETIIEENFDFYGRTLSGTPVIRERWRRGVGLVESVLGEALGKLYVEEHFPAASKDRMITLVGNLIEAYRESINGLDWMGEDTRKRALTKLGTFTPKIGYPDEWKSFDRLELTGDDLVGNVARASAWAHDYEFAKLGKPVDRNEWFMTPQTVNAYYNPQMNEIVFPAAILQPPFFDADADDAANYGGIGAVIGHEIGHGFDDQGSRYDGEGNLKDWWEESDRSEFMERANALIAQYNELSPLGLPDAKVNGALTVGENIGDLGGLTIALKAYALSLGDSEAPIIDGLTGEQRVMFGWAQVWRGKYRPEEAQRLLAIDPHSPPNLRCNAVVSNLDVYHAAFDVQPGDAGYLPESERVRIW